MKSSPAETKIIALTLLGGVLPLLASLAAYLVLGDAKHVQEPLHEGFELVGACIALSVAMLLLIRLRQESAPPHLLWVVAALVAMGIVDGVHSFLPTGVAFSWTRHGATLVGGAIFALVWLPPPAAAVCRKQHFIVLVAALALAGSLAILCWPERLPAPWVAGEYSRSVIAVNALGGLGFLAGALFFIRRYLRAPQTEDLVFASQTLLFSTASLVFGFSHVWAADWWVWHGARLLAYGVLLAVAHETVVMLYQHLARRARELETANAALGVEMAERKQAAEALRRNEALLRAFFDSGGALRGIVELVDGDVRFLVVNEAAAALYGRTPDTMRQQLASQLGALRESLELATQYYEQCRESGTPAHYETQRQVGSEARWLAVTVSCLGDGPDGPPRFAFVATDITERKRTEAVLRENQRVLEQQGRMLAQTQEAARVGGWELDLATRRLYWTEETYRIHEVTPATYTPTLESAINFYAPESRPLIAAAVQAAVAEGKEWDLELELITATQRRIWVRAVGKVQFSGGRPAKAYGAFQDTTGRKRAEQEIHKLNAELEQRVQERTRQLEEANQELEAFSYSVSHDLRAPLRGIDGFSQAIEEDCADKLDDIGRAHLARVRAAAQRMGELIDDLLKLSRVMRAELHRLPVDLSALARTIAGELQQREPQRQVQWEIADGLTVEGDAPLLRVALENLLGNAWKFTAKKTEARIEFGVATRGAGESSIQHPASRTFFVRDNGAGFDMAHENKLFGAFQRLHTVGEFEGTGIGLATVQRILHRHGGRIWAEGEMDKGATFYFNL